MNVISLIIPLMFAAVGDPGGQVNGALDHNCRITVEFHLKTGEMRTQTYRLHAKSERDCRKKAKLHEINFALRVVKSKKARFEWLGGRSGHTQL